MGEDLGASLDGVEVLGVRADLDPVENGNPAVNEIQRRYLLQPIKSKAVVSRLGASSTFDETYLRRVDGVQLNARWEVAQEVQGVDVDERDCSRSATVAKREQGSQHSFGPTRSRKNPQLDDDKVLVSRRARPLRLPPVSHVLSANISRALAVSSCFGEQIEDEVLDVPSSRKEQVGPNSVVLVALVHAPTSVQRVREVPLSLHVPKVSGSSGVPGVRRGPDGRDDSVRPEPSDTSVGDLAQAEVGVGGRCCGDGEDVSLRRAQGNDRQERLPLSKQSRE